MNVVIRRGATPNRKPSQPWLLAIVIFGLIGFMLGMQA